MRNLFTHLFSFSEKDQVKIEKDQVKIEKDQVRQNGRGGGLARFLWVRRSERTANSMSVCSEAEGGTMVYKSPANDTLITGLSRGNHALLHCFGVDKTSLRFLRYVAMIFAVLVMSMANIGMAWGADFTPAQIVTSGGTTTDHVKVSTVFSTQTNKQFCSSETGLTGVNVNNSASANWNTYYIEIAATDGYTLSSLSLKVASSGSSNATEAVAFWNGAASVACSSYASFTAPGYSNSSCANTVIDVPAGTKTVRLYRKICISKSDYKTFASSNKVDVGGSTTYYVFGITATASGGGGCTSHSVNLNSSGSVTGGTFATSSSTVCEGETATLTATPAAGYVFTSWSASGTGSSLSSTTTNPTTLTMGTADVSVNATFTKVYASGTYTFYGNTIVGSSPSKTVTTTATDYDAFRIDNLFFSSTNIQYESGSGSTESNDYYGWKVKKSSTIKFFVEDDSDVKICIGTIGGGTCTVSYTDHSSVAHNNTSISSGSHETYEVKGGTMVTLSMAPSSSKSVTLKQIMITPSVSCTAPNHVDISSSTGEFGFFGGETITLTAQAYSSAGTGSPIAEGSITGYQWKRNGTNISGATSKTLTINNCTVSNAGDYSCVVSTGATCSTESSSYGTKVYVLQQYIGGETTYNFTRVGTSKVGTVNVTLAASTQREFKIYAGTMTSESYYMGNNGTIDEDASNWDFEGGKNNVKLNPGLGGTFTFTIDYTANGGAPKVSVTYPRKTMYLTPGVWNADGAKFAIYYFRDGGTTAWTDFLTVNDCGMSADIPQWNGITVIPVRLKNTTVAPGNWSDVWNQTNNITVNSNNSIVITGWDASNFTYGTYAVPTYTISYNAGTGGSGSKASESKTCGVDFTLPNSAVFTREGYLQTGWTTSDGGVQTHALGGTYTTNAAQAFYPVWTPNNYTITLNGNGGTGNTSSVTATYNSATLSTSITNPTKDCYTFDGWFSGEGGTGTLIINTSGVLQASTTYTGAGGIWTNDGNVTLYAKWTKTPTSLILQRTGDEATPGGGSPIGTEYTLTCSAETGSISSYQWKQNISGTKVGAVNAVGTGTTSANFSPVPAAAGTYWYFCVATDACGNEVETSLSGCFTFTALELTALECNTLYTPANMLPSGKSITSSWQKDAYGLSGNTKFFIVGAGGTDDADTDAGIVEIKTGSAVSISGEDYSNFCYFKKAPQMSGTTPTSKAIKFIIASSGNLDVYGKGELALVKEGGSPTTKDCTGTPSKVTWTNLTAGTYYLYATGTSRYMVAMQLICCSTPANPDGLSAGSITSEDVTFTITDDESPASYDIYYSTSSTAPTSGTAATTTTTSKTKAVTGLTPSTTYYAWVRAVCDESHKSSWVALSGSTFTTDAPDCKVSLSKVVLTSASAGTVTGYNAQEFAGDAVIGGLKGTETAEVDASNDGVETGYKLNNSGSAIVFATLKESFHEGDVVKVTITKENDNYTFPSPVSAKTGMDIYYGTDKDDATLLTTLSGVTGPGTYSYTLTAADITTIGSKKGIGVFRHSDRAQNHHIYSVEILGCREHATVYSFSNGSFTDWGTCNGGTLTLSGSQSGVNYQLYKDGVASGDAKAGTGSALNWTVTASGTYTVKSVANASYAETAMTGTAVVTLQDPALSGESSVEVGSTITLTHPGYLISGGSWTSSNGSVATVTDGVVTGVAVGTATITFHGVGACDGSKLITVTAAAVHHDVTFSLTNVVYSSGDNQGTDAATEGVAFSTVFAASSGYDLPSTITVTIGGSPATETTDYTWNSSTGALEILAASVTGNIVVTIAGEVAPTTKDIYYGHVKITDGALVREIPSGATQFFTNIGGTVANNTEISLSSTPSTGGIYYNSNNLTDTELSKSSNWGSSSGSNRYIRGLKFANGTTYTLALGTKVASAITFYGWCGSASKTMTVGGEEYVSSSTKNKFAKHVFTKSGDFTGNVTITQDGDFYGILVITIQTAAPCTTPVIPSLSDQTVCPGSDIAAWDATQTAVLADGETASYSWKKKGNDTELAPTASFDLGSSATESQTGTYVVTVTVSKVGKASASASAEVDLTVTPATEEPSVSQSPATVYVSNSVTLTATCGSAGTLTWSWHTCNSDGSGESSAISGATTNTYALTAPASAGTYYYKVKVTGDGTNACGTASHVYALTVAAASECENYYWFIYADDATANGVINNRDGFFSNTSTGTGNTGTYTMTVDGVSMTGTKRLSTAAYAPKFTVPAGATATLYIYGKAASSDAGKHLVLKRTSDDEEVEVTSNTTVQGYTKEDIEPGEWTLSCGSSNWCYSFFAVKVCSTSSCTDATPTIAAVNNTVCSGTKMRIDATGYETGATFKWQKLNTSTSSWDDVAGATLDSLVIASVTASNAGSYRFIATKGCARTSNTVTIAVPSAPVFGDVPSSVSVMQTLALSISTVEATDAVKYRWYKSADDTWDAGDVEIGTDKTLIKAYAGEATGSPSYYVFCRAQNACGITTSSAIAVNVTTYVEEDCATKGNEGEAQFEFENTSCSQGTYSSESAWYTNSRTKYLTYTAPEGKYFDEAKVRIAVSSGSKCGYAYSTDGGANWTYAEKTGLSSDLADVTIDLTGNVNAFRIGRNLQDGSSKDWGVTSGNFYLTKACFTYINACTSTTVTPSSSSVNYEIGGVWSSPTFTLSPAVGTLTYSSSDEDIASVDDEGAVTFNGDAGTVTITASYAGDGTYCASEGSYTITVSCSGGAPKVVPDGTVNMSGCNSSVILHAKQQDGTSDFADGTYQWFRDGEEISGATSASYTAVQAGIYTVERTNAGGCTTPSTNSAVVTSETTEPEVERLVPFQYYHVNKTYSDQMKMRHLFAVKNSGKLDGKSFKLYVSRNGGAATEVTNSNALAIWTNADGRVDTVMVDLNKLSGKYSEDDELVYTCKAIDCEGNVSDVYMNTITMHVIGATPTLALICSGSNKEGGTRKTGELTVGGDFLTGYNKADLCEQTGNTSFNADVEWGLYTRLKANYIVTPVNGYAVFNKLNYEPFDILLLTDYPKASKSDAAATVLDDMADLVDFRPMLSLKAHMVSKTPSKWAAKGFTTSPVHVTGGDGRIYMNIVCYAHPMFDGIKEAGDHIFRDHSDNSQIVYEVLTGPGHENNKGLQGFEIEAAENFVTIGLIHYNASAAENIPSTGELTWTGGKDKNNKPNDRMLVAAVERQTNLEARLIVLAVNCGAQSKFTETGRTIVHKCLEYLLSDATDPITPVADCSFTFDNGAGAPQEAEWYQDPAHCPGCTGTLGDGKWSTAANWGPDRVSIPGEFTSVRIAAPVTVDMEHAHAMEARIVEGGSIEIPAGKALEVKSTIRRFDGSEISPTEVSDIFIGSSAAGNGTLIFNNDKGDSKATVAMYTTALADVANMSAATSTWQYIGTPHNDVAVARYNYYNSWLYQYDTGTEGWTVIPNGGPLVPFRGYCVTHPEANHTFVMDGKLTATTNADIAIPANKYVVVANSWVAPIDINAITDDDMEGMTDKTIYFFNTGTDTEGTGGTGTAAGTYRATPLNAASYTGDWQIPSMQGFYVVGGSSDGTLHLDYSRHVRPSDARSVVGNPMYTPRRSAESNEPEVAKLYFRGHRYYDRLIVLEREDFTRGYDSGWDGEAWGGNDAAPMSYVSTEGRWDAVSAVPEYEGTVIGFRAGEDNEYTIDFEYSPESEPLYLLDTENNTYTQVIVGNAYHFTTGDKASHERFVLTRKSPSVTTEIDNVQRDNVPSTKARKILIEDKLFIMINGLLYDATGKVVK